MKEKNEIKICTKCKHELPATEEYFAKRTDTCRLRRQCRKCRTAIRKTYYEVNKDKVLEQSSRWKRENKEQKQETHKKWYNKNKETVLQKSRDDYHENIERERARNKVYRDAHKKERLLKRMERYRQNTERENLQARIWYQKNKDIHLKNSRIWRKNNPDKAIAIMEKYRANKLSNGGEYSEKDIFGLYHRQRGLCLYCEGVLGNKYHVDHVVPLSKGGSNYCGNIVLACPSCNSSKSNKLLVEWKRHKSKVA